MSEQAGTSMTKQGRYCRGCGSQIRSGARFCAACGLAAENDRGMPASPPQAPQPRETYPIPPPRPGRRNREPTRRRVRVLAIWTGVLAVVGGAAGILVLAHPFDHQRLVASVASRHTVASRPSLTPPASPPAVPSSSLSYSPGSSASSSPSASPLTEQQAAANLAVLLSRSTDDRQAVQSAVNDVTLCGPNLTKDVRTFQSAYSSHRQLLNELATMPGQAALPQAMTRFLGSAWQASASADADFAKWAQDQVADGCSPANQSDPNFNAADEPDVQATQEKTAFLQSWNQLAQAYGLQTYSQSDL